MKKLNKKVLSASTITAVLLSSSLSAVNVKADNLISPPENSRLWGQDRYETAVKVSQTGWTSSDYAVIASGEGYADALCAAPLAKANNAPILLTENGKLNDKTLEELKRLNVKHVYIVGGQGVVAKAVEDSIKSNTKIDIERFAGQNRYETSVKVAEKIGVTSKVVLASGEGYADALSAAPVAAIEGIPVILTESKTLSAPTADYIKANKDLTKTYVIGGYASVSDSTMNSVPGAQRFGGANRYETNVKVIENFASDFEFNNAYVALGNGPIGNEFADALTGSALAAKNKNPLILVSKDLDKSTENLLTSKFPKTATITVLGGTANISDSLVSSIKSNIENSTATKPSTGGGGSSSSTTQYSDIHNMVANFLINKAESQVLQHPNIASQYDVQINKDEKKIDTKYFSIDAGKNPILITNKTGYDTLEEIFERAKEKGNNTDKEALISNLQKVQQQIDIYSSMIDVNGKELKECLANRNSKYLDEAGNLKIEEIANEIIDNTLNFDEFKSAVENIIKANVNTDSKDPSITIKGQVITKIVKDGTTLYDTSMSKQESIDVVKNLIDATTEPKGSFIVYCNEESFFKVTVQ